MHMQEHALTHPHTCMHTHISVLFICFSQLRIYAQPSQLKTADYAANTTKIIFDYFEEYFNMSYSIGKLGNYKNVYYHTSYHV